MSGQLHASAALPQGKKLNIHRVGGWKSPRADLDDWGGGEQVVRRHGRHWNKVQRRIDGRDDKEPLLVCGSELTYLKY